MLPPTLHDFLLAHQNMLWWLAGTSVLLFFGTLIVLPILLIRLPADYFCHQRRNRLPWAHHHPLIRAILILGKNITGLILLLAGMVMLVLPGQGLLTMTMGFVLLDLPGKYRLERWFISRPAILRPINWLRRRAGHPLLIVNK